MSGLPAQPAESQATRLRRVLITGATGYTGSHVATAALERGCEVHALTRGGPRDGELDPRVRKYTISASDDLSDACAQIVASADPDAVLHLASMISASHTPQDIEPMLRTNVTLGLKLAQALQSQRAGELDRPGVFIHAGSWWSFDAAGNRAPNSLYAATKLMLHDGLSALTAANPAGRGLRAMTLVLFDVFGPDDRRDKLIPALVRLARERASGSASFALDGTPGTQLVDFVHVQDVARGFLDAADQLFGGELSDLAAGPGPRAALTYALPGAGRRRLREVVGVLEQVAGVGGLVRWDARPFPSGQVHEPVRTIPALPGWRASITVESGLREVWRHGVDGGVDGGSSEAGPESRRDDRDDPARGGSGSLT